MKKNVDFGLLILRLMIGGMMILHGIAKISHGIGGIEGMLVGKGMPGFLAYGVYVGEIIAPLAIVIGYRTKLAALIFAINCLAAVFLAHSGDVFSLSPQGGWAIELLGMYLFGSIALIFTGGGRFGLSSISKWD